MNYGLFILRFMGFASLNHELWDFILCVYRFSSLKYWKIWE